MTEKRLKTPRGTVVYWRSEGPEGKPALVLLHGLTGDHTLFDAQTERWEGRYPLIVWDAPAHGCSRPYADFSYARAAEDLRAMLDQEGVARAVLIGQSMGGMIAQAFLKRWPERAAAFVAVDSCPYGEGYYSRSDRRWLRQVEWMARLFPVHLLKESMARLNAATAPARENMRRMVAPYGKRELCRLMGIGYAAFLEDNGELHIDCPTMLLLGEKDRTGKVRAYNRAWAARTGFPLTVISGAAHNANADQPEAVNRAIEDFLARLDAP